LAKLASRQNRGVLGGRGDNRRSGPSLNSAGLLVHADAMPYVRRRQRRSWLGVIWPWAWSRKLRSSWLGGAVLWGMTV
jgi:hypothetical protein